VYTVIGARRVSELLQVKGIQSAKSKSHNEPCRSREMNAWAGFAPARKTDRRILGAILAVTGAGVLVKLTATIKEITVAAIYGRSDAMDAFLAASLIPALLVNLIAESMNQVLIPSLVKAREKEGQARAQMLLSNAMLWSCCMLVAASVAMAISARWFFPLIAWQFSTEKLLLAENLFYAQLAIVVLVGIASNCTAVLNIFDQFGAPALVPVVTPLAIIVSAVTMGRFLGVWAMVCAMVAGAAIHAVWTAWMMHRHGFRFQLRWYGWDSATRDTALQFGPVLLSSVVASGGLLVDQAMAATLPAGSVSALAYGNRFVSVAIALLGGAVAAAVTPHFSRMVADENWKGCRETLSTWVRYMAFASIPIAVLLIAGSKLLVHTAFEHGAFRRQDTEVVAPVLAMYAVQIPFFVCSRVFYRFLLAMRRTDLIFYCGLLNLGLDIILNFLLMRLFGVAGIALATSLWTVSTLIFLWYWSRKLVVEKIGTRR
jgi:putative peptidoglycan lipid II flippase